MDRTVLLIIAVIVAVAVPIEIRLVREARRLTERDKAEGRVGTKAQEIQYGWLGHIHGYWWALGSAVAGLKYIYKAWKTAPVGTPERLGWGCLLALILAAVVYAVVRLVDKKLNGSREVASPESLSGEGRSG